MTVEKIVKVPYTTRPIMKKNTESVFTRPPHPAILESKINELKLYGQDLSGNLNPALVSQVAQYLQLPDTDNIVDLALGIEEDIAILHRDILHAICFCFPSNWLPQSGLGKTLAELHGPVADGNELQAASGKISKTIRQFDRGSFTRHVWTVTPIPYLGNHPDLVRRFRDHPIDISNLYFRTETQTTLPMPDNETSVFFVQVDIIRLSDLTESQLNLICQSINSMTESVLQYKNLTKVKTYLNNFSN